MHAGLNVVKIATILWQALSLSIGEVTRQRVCRASLFSGRRSLLGTAVFPDPAAGKPAGQPLEPLTDLEKIHHPQRRGGTIPCPREFFSGAAPGAGRC
jgi:hypothetical protein